MKNIDHISSLPEELIHKILCDISIKDIAQTSSLSKQWKSFSDPFLYLNFDQQLLSLPYHQFKQLADRRLQRLKGNDIVCFHSRICIRPKDVYPSHIHRWVSLIAQTNVKEFDFRIIKDPNQFSFLFFGLPRQIYNTKTVTVLKLSGCEIPFCDNIRLSQLKKLRLENVFLENDSVLVQFFISCPLLMELGLVECHGLKNLQVSGLAQLQQLEIGLCSELKVVEIQALGLQILLLSETETTRIRGQIGGNPLTLSICSKTVENLRGLKLLNSSLSGKAFRRLFSGCSNLASLVLSNCNKIYKICISSQKLRRLVMESCQNIIFSDIVAPKLRSAKFVSCPWPFYVVGTDQLQHYTIDRSSVFPTLDGHVWFDWFKNSVSKSHDGDCQKIVVFLNEQVMTRRYDVFVLEGWSSMEELQFLTKLISSEARRIIITNMSFPDLGEYLFRDHNVYTGATKLVAISSAESKLYEALKRKPKYFCEYCSSISLSERELGKKASSTYWQPFSAESSETNTKDGYIYKALMEEGMAATLRATLFSVKKGSYLS